MTALAGVGPVGRGPTGRSAPGRAGSRPVEERILAGAARCFTDVGVRKTTVAEIAAAAGITKPTFYRRFADKSDVVEALVRRETDDLARRMRDAGAGHTAADDLLAAFRTAARWLTRHPFVRKSLDLEPELLMPHLNQPDGPVLSTGHAVFAEIVAGGSASGEFRAVDPAAVAEVCWRLVLSFALTPLPDSHGDGARTDELIRATLLDGIRNDRAQVERVQVERVQVERVQVDRVQVDSVQVDEVRA